MKLTFTAEFKDGLVYVTSPDVPGLLVTGRGLGDAMAHVAEGVSSLCFAVEMERALGRPAAPVIRFR